MQPQVRDVSFQAQTLHPSLYYPRFHGGKNLFIICFQAAKPSCKFLKVVLNKFSRLCFKDLSLDIGCCCTHFLPCPFTDVVVQCVLGRKKNVWEKNKFKGPMKYYLERIANSFIFDSDPKHKSMPGQKKCTV